MPPASRALPMSFLLALAAAAPAARASVSAPSDELAAKVAAFEKAFHSAPKRRRSAEERTEALALLAGLDAPPVAQALVRAYEEIEAEVVAAQERKQEVDERIASIVRGQEFAPTRTLPAATRQAFQQLKAEALALDAGIVELLGVEAALLQAVERLQGDESMGWLVTNVTGSTKLPLSLKVSAARTAGDRGEAMAGPLMKALARATSAEELAVLLEGIARCRLAAQPCAPIVLAALAHEDAAVREKAALALAGIAAPEAIEPLVARLEIEAGATRRRIGIALEILTRQNLGDSAHAWREWLAREGAEYVAGRRPLGGGTSTLAAALTAPPSGAKSVYYYGIPQEGRSIVYVIDCSGSMVVSAKRPEYAGGSPVDAGPESRMEATKDALIEVLGKLTRDQRFDVVAFNDLPYVFSPRLLAGTPGEVRKAQEWVRGLAGASSTNIHDALDEAFRLAGRGLRDKHYRSAVDTIFLLTDGTPTNVDGSLDSTDRVLQAVRRWNPARHVVIHTIGIGREINVPFLQQLARENGGRFVQQ